MGFPRPGRARLAAALLGLTPFLPPAQAQQVAPPAAKPADRKSVV